MATYDLAYPGAAIDAILNTAYFLQEAGYIFQGSASEYSGTPSKRVWLIAPAGFTGLGLSSAVPQGSIGICLYNGTAWVGKVINVLTLDSEPTRNSQNGVTSGGVAATLDEIAGGIMETFASLLFDDETASADLSTKLSYAVKFSVSNVYQTVTHLNILAATTSKAGLMSAEDKAKVDSFLTNLRSLTFSDTTASADQGTQITETLKATIGGVQEVIDSITILAATSSKAGLLSASDKAYIDALPATLTSLSNSISGALALMQSLVGYYVCDTAAGTAAKTVAATGYSLTNGGCIRIKMINANTAANATLNINGTGAKALYYDGAQASSTNTWEAGEVLEVYYDGTQYQCASGGGGKFATGEAVKNTGITNSFEQGADNELLTKQAMSDVIYGTETITETLTPTEVAMQGNNRLRIDYVGIIKNGDAISFAGNGYDAYIGVVNSEGTEWQEIISDYTTSFEGVYMSGNSRRFRFLVRKVGGADFSKDDALNNITYSITREIGESGLIPSVEDLYAKIGYYVCSSGAAAKKEVSAQGFVLSKGGCIHIMMTNANTMDNATLNINSTGDKALFYNAVQASSTNTWKAGEVLEVYYDGTKYQCSTNGMVSAKDVAYDNTDSGIEANNVQDALDIYAESLENCFVETSGGTETVQITQSDIQNGAHEWGANNTRIVTKKDSLIPIDQLTKISLHIPASSVSGTAIDRAAIIFYNASYRHISALDKPWTTLSGSDVDITKDLTGSEYAQAAYAGLYMGSASASSSIPVSSLNTSGMYFTLYLKANIISPAVSEMMFSPVQDKTAQHQTILSDCYHVNNINPSTLSVPQEGLVNKVPSFASNPTRIILDKDYLLNVIGKSCVRMEIPYSAVSSQPVIDRVTMDMYNSNKTLLSSLDLGWYYFNGSTVIIEVQLSDELYKDVCYVTPYFGQAYTNELSPSSIVASAIDVTVWEGEVYTTKAIDADTLKDEIQFDYSDVLPSTEYLGERISLAMPYTYSRYSYSYERIGTLSSGSGARQGGATYGKYFLQFHANLNNIVIFDMETRQNIQTVPAISVGSCHANNGGFSSQFYDPSDPLPLLYISRQEDQSILVFRITGTEGNFAFTLIQTITVESPYYYQNMAIDPINGRIICFGYLKNSWNDATDNMNVFWNIDIPPIDSDVTIQPSSFRNMFKLPFVYAIQNAFALYNRLYIAFGNTASNGGIFVVDYINGRVLSYLCVRVIGNLEPEGMGAYQDKIAFSDQNGRVYLLTF